MSNVSVSTQMADFMNNTQDLLGSLKTVISNSSDIDYTQINSIISSVSTIISYALKENPLASAATFSSNLSNAYSDSQKFTAALNSNNTHDMIVYGLSLVSDCAAVEEAEGSGLHSTFLIL